MRLLDTMIPRLMRPSVRAKFRHIVHRKQLDCIDVASFHVVPWSHANTKELRVVGHFQPPELSKNLALSQRMYS